MNIYNYCPYKVSNQKQPRRIIKSDENRFITSSANNIYTEIARPSGNQEKKKKFATDKIKFSKKAIKDHIERKVQLYLLGAVATYNTPEYFYEIGVTNAQGPSSRKITVRTDSGNFSQKLQSVHSSPLPAIYVCLRKEYEDWKNHLINESDLQRYRLFHKSEFDDKQNSTEPLPDFINRADTLLEGSKNDGKLRDVTINIINGLAVLNFNFSEGLSKFLESYERLVDQTLANLKPSKFYEKDKEVLLIFKNHIHYLLEKNGSYQLEDHFFGLNTQDQPEDIRQEIYKVRAKEIQQRFSSQSQLSKVICPFRTKSLRGKKQAPHNYEQVIKLRILEKMDDEQERSALEGHFSLTKEELDTLSKDLDQAKKVFDSKDYSEELETLKEKLQNALKIKDAQEMEYQSSMLKVLMEGTGLDTIGLLEIYNETFADEQLLEDDLRDILNQKAKMNKKLAAHLADIFLTTPDLFFRDSI